MRSPPSPECCTGIKCICSVTSEMKLESRKVNTDMIFLLRENFRALVKHRITDEFDVKMGWKPTLWQSFGLSDAYFKHFTLMLFSCAHLHFFSLGRGETAQFSDKSLPLSRGCHAKLPGEVASAAFAAIYHTRPGSTSVLKL